MANSIRLSFTGSENIQKFVPKNPFFLKKKGMKALRKFILSVAFRCKFAIFSDFIKKRIFFRKTYLVLIEKTNFWSLWGSLLFQLPSAANLLPLAILKEARFSRKTLIFWERKPKFCTLWVISPPQSVSMETFLPLTFGCYNIILYSVSKSRSYFKTIPNIQYFEKFFLQSHSPASLLPFGIFEKKQDFSWKIHIPLMKNHILNVFRSFNNSVAFDGNFSTFEI